jgi:D-ribose pyranose/furanose isomerase RbsD
MKKRGLLNAPLSQVIAEMGHGDLLVIADAGLPIPLTVARIDLAVRPGLPPSWRSSMPSWRSSTWRKRSSPWR